MTTPRTLWPRTSHPCFFGKVGGENRILGDSEKRHFLSSSVSLTVLLCAPEFGICWIWFSLYHYIQFHDALIQTNSLRCQDTDTTGPSCIQCISLLLLGILVGGRLSGIAEWGEEEWGSFSRSLPLVPLLTFSVLPTLLNFLGALEYSRICNKCSDPILNWASAAFTHWVVCPMSLCMSGPTQPLCCMEYIWLCF